MSITKRQIQPNNLSELELSDLIEHDDNPNLFVHLQEDFQELMHHKDSLHTNIEKFINNTVDEYTLGIIFDLHRKTKLNAYCLDVEHGMDEEEVNNKTIVFHQIAAKNNQKCICPYCEHQVVPMRFAWHLAKCMGVSDTSRTSRQASRRAVTNNKDKSDSSAYVELSSDDDDEEQSNSRRTTKKKDKNGGKKNRGTPKKSVEPEIIDQVNVDIDCEIIKRKFIESDLH